MRSRTEEAAAAVVTHCLQRNDAGYHVFSVGSGPAYDIYRALTLLPEDGRSRLRVTLLDIDPEALQFAFQQVQAFLPFDGAKLAQLPQ